MSSSTRHNTSYDERYAVPLEASRRGAHRARRNPLLGLLPAVLVAVVVLAVGFGAYTVFKPDTTSSSSVAGADEAVPDDGGDSTATAPASASSTSASPSTSDTSSATATDTTGTAAGDADKTVAVKLLNGAGVTGLAAKVKSNLADDEWSSIAVDTAKNKYTKTTIYYGSNSMLPTAQAMATDLKYDLLKKDSTIAGEGITVVLGSDYELP